MFSKNETIEDLPTDSMPFMLVDYWIGTSMQRRNLLKEAIECMGGFIEMVDGYRVLQGEQAYRSNGRDRDSSTALPSSRMSSEQQRQAKIATFKRVKELEASVSQSLQFIRNKGSSGSNPQNRAPSDLARACYTNMLELHYLRAIDEISIMELELEMQAIRKRATDPDAKADEGRRGGYGEPARPPPGSKPTTRITQPFVLMPPQSRDRAAVAANVYRPPAHSLPTMTVDEYLEIEMQKGIIPSSSGAGAGGRPNQQQQAAPSDSSESEETLEQHDTVTVYKGRSKDAFRDEHRRGSGNTMNRS